MQSIYLLEAQHIKDFNIEITFSTKEKKTVNLKNIVMKYEQAKELRNIENFKHFYLDDWPTLAWNNGFDISPDYLYELSQNT